MILQRLVRSSRILPQISRLSPLYRAYTMAPGSSLFFETPRYIPHRPSASPSSVAVLNNILSQTSTDTSQYQPIFGPS
jgi:hypothetical protein